MRANPRTRIRLAARTHTHVYARIRAREGNFLTPNLLYSITRPSSIISPSPFTTIVQSLYNPYQCWHHIDYAICTNCQHLSSSVAHLPYIYNHYPTIRHLSFISHLSPIHYHCFPSSHIHHIPSLSNIKFNRSPSYQYASML